MPHALSIRRKLEILADAAKYDASCASSGSRRETPAGGLGNVEGMGICHSYTPDGRCVSLLKVLLTNHCIYDCQYCVNRISSDVPRARFTPDELVWLTIEFYRRNLIEGLFLSSGIIKSVDQTMEELVAVARKLRVEHRFGGYIHLKTIAGCSVELIAEAGKYADRLSANVELPTEQDLARLAPDKKLSVIERSMANIRTESESAAPGAFAPAGQSTQMVVGATDTTDADIMRTASRLYDEHALRRVYYTAYSPIPHADQRLPPSAPPLVREHRLYQADWLVRRYGFGVEELIDPSSPNLDADIDPKLAWALRNRALFPIDVNLAARETLLRVPGLGERCVKGILAARRQHRLRLADVTKLGGVVSRARPFIYALDHHPDVHALDRVDLRDRVKAVQLDLFGGS